MAGEVSLSKVCTDKAIVVASLLVLLGLGLTGKNLFGVKLTTKGKGVANAQGYTHLRCSTCGDQIPYAPELVGTTCESCEKGAAYRPITDLQSANAARVQGGKIAVFAMIALVLLLTLTHLIIYRIRCLRREELAERNQNLMAQCPFCNRKITYSISRIGTVWVCPQCKTAFQLPSFA